jgi:MFS family permease
MIMPIFPVMAKELHLNYKDIGIIAGALSLAWGTSAFFTGGLTDKIGTKKVLVGSLIVFSLLAGVSGLATGLVGLVIIRALIGVSEGAYAPTGQVATIEASRPDRQGRNIGIQQMAMPLLGMALAPLLVVQILHAGVSWRWVFALVSIPGLIVAALMAKVLKSKENSIVSHTALQDTADHKWWQVFGYHNVPLQIIITMGWMSCEMSMAAMMASYLTDYLHLGLMQMGFVLSALGFGAASGALVLPTLSDYLGRKPVTFIFGIVDLCAVLLFRSTGADPVRLFILLFLVLFCSQGLNTISLCLISSESVPAKLIGSSNGVTVGIAEIFGGGIVPILAGLIAHTYGIHNFFYLSIGGCILGTLVSLLLQETAPRRVASRSARVQHSVA